MLILKLDLIVCKSNIIIENQNIKPLTIKNILDIVIMYVFYILIIMIFLIHFREVKYGISLYYSCFIFYYSNGLYFNVYSVFSNIKIVEF